MVKEEGKREVGEDVTEQPQLGEEAPQPISQDVPTESVDKRIGPALNIIKEFLERAKEKQEDRASLDSEKEAAELELQNAEKVEDQNELIYVTLDGDNIGNVVFQAEQTNDEEKVKEIDRRINAGQQVMQAWAEENNGKTVQAGGDEGLLKVPRKAMDRIEELRQKYYDAVKATVTVGVGRKISEAMAARQLGKLQGKDRTVEFTETTQQELDMRIQQEDVECDEKLKTCIQSGGMGQGSIEQKEQIQQEMQEEADAGELPKYALPEGMMDGYMSQHQDYMSWANKEHRSEDAPVQAPGPTEEVKTPSFQKPVDVPQQQPGPKPQKPGAPQAAAPEQPKQAQPPEEVKPRIKTRHKKPVTEASRKWKKEREVQKNDLSDRMNQLRKAIRSRLIT